MAVNFPDSPSNGQTFTSNGLTFTWNGSAWKLDPSSGTKGEKGQKGEVGEKGSKGDKGIKGEVGDKGQKGEIGPAGGSGGIGAKGDKGQKGELNDKGQKGESGSATITNNADNRVITGGTGTNLNGEANLTFDGSKLRLPDNIELQLGTDGATSGNGDLRILHDGESKIWDNGAGGLVFQTGSSPIEMRAIGQPSDEVMIKATPGGTVDLYADGTKRFETNSTGAKVIGNLEVTGSVTTSGSTVIPVATIVAYGGNSAPSGWQLCNGGSASTSALQAIVGSNVPDLRDRFIVGSGSSYNVGNTGGSASVTLTTAQMPSHKHDTTFDNKKYFPGGGSTNIGYGGAGGYPADVFSMSNEGGGQAHENRPPYYALTYIIKT